jgi:diguanylate cyclase (GGDEF)-like protein
VRNMSLLRKFAVLSAVTIVLLGAGLAWLLSRQVQERVIADAAAAAELFADSVILPLLSPEDLQEGLDFSRIGPLDRAASRAQSGGRVARIKVWSPDGQIVYSDDHTLMGRVFPRSEDLQEALEGKVVTEISELEEAEEASEREHEKLVEIYVPLRFTQAAEPAGAFEMYLPYEPIVASIERDTGQLYLVLLGALGLLYAALFRIVSGASGTLRRQAAENEHLALHDRLTDLPNRVLFRDRAQQAIRAGRRSGERAGVMIIDLDRFKEINDALGHHTGDLLLEQVGPRLRAVLRETDTVARLGGDEFGVLLPNLRGAMDAHRVADKIASALARPFSVGDMTLEAEASIGFALFPDHGEDVDELLQRADVAMYLAKENRTGSEPYSVERDRYSPERLVLLGELRQAIDRGEITLHYQPKADLETGRVAGVEALARWEHPRLGLLQPADFIPLAEPTGLMRPLTAHIVDRAVHQLRAWRERGMPLRVAVNLSVRNLQDPTFPDLVAAVLERWDVEPNWLELEITESAIMQEPTRALEVVQRLHDMGVSLAVDDFGIGHSSLAYLKRLPVRQLKIDRSFVTHMDRDENDPVIVKSTIDLGRNLGLQVVAEGVETAAVWERLSTLGCDFAQGFYLSHPLPPEELAVWLRSAGAVVPGPRAPAR